MRQTRVMAQSPEAMEAGRRRSALAVAAGATLIVLAVPAVLSTYSAELPVEVQVTAAPTTTIDPAAVGLRRLDRALELDSETFGAIGFMTGAVVVVLTDSKLVVIDLDGDLVGVLADHPLGEVVESFDSEDRSVVIARTSAGAHRIDARGRIEELALEPPPPDRPSGAVTLLCDHPCDRVLVSPTAGGSWSATFDAPMVPDAPPPAVSALGDMVAAWVAEEGTTARLEIATAERASTVPFSNEVDGAPALLRWATEGDGVIYGWVGEPRIVVFSPRSRASGTVWLDEPVRYAAAIPAS